METSTTCSGRTRLRQAYVRSQELVFCKMKGSDFLEGQSTAYTSKTIQHGNVTITIMRPVLSDGEREKRKKQIVESLGNSLRDYLQRQH